MNRIEAALRALLGSGFGYRSGVRKTFSSIHDVEHRWSLIRPHLPERSCWILDIGTNDGDTCRRCAALGHYALGLEIDARYLAMAKSHVQERVAFMQAAVSPEMLSGMPHFDVVFLLSVLHRLWAVHGRQYAEQSAREAFGRGDLVVIEGAIRHARYVDMGIAPPEFPDENVEAAIEWHLSWLNGLVPPGWVVSFLGPVYPLNRNAPRILFIARSNSF